MRKSIVCILQIRYICTLIVYSKLILFLYYSMDVYLIN